MSDIGTWQVVWAKEKYEIVKRLDGEKKAEKLDFVDLNQKRGVASQLKLIGKLVLKRLPAI